MSNELMLNKIEKVIETSKVQIGEAQEIASKYAPLMNRVSEQADLIQRLEKGNKEDVAKAKRIRIDLGKIAGDNKRQKQADKESVLIRGRFIDSLYNTVNGAIEITKEEALGIEKHFERQEAERIEKLRIKREKQIFKYTDVIPPNLGEMQQEVWDNYFKGTKQNYEARIEAEKKAEAERIEKQRVLNLHNERKELAIPFYHFWSEFERQMNFGEVSQSDFDAFMERLKNQKQEFDAEQARIKAENERLAKEKEEAEAKIKAEREKAKAVARELEAKRQEELRIEREKQAKLEAELKAKREAEAKAEAERKASALRKKKEAEERAKAPIKRQLTLWIDEFQTPEIDVQNDVKERIQKKFEDFKKWAKLEIQSI